MEVWLFLQRQPPTGLHDGLSSPDSQRLSLENQATESPPGSSKCGHGSGWLPDPFVFLHEGQHSALHTYINKNGGCVTMSIPKVPGPGPAPFADPHE